MYCIKKINYICLWYYDVNIKSWDWNFLNLSRRGQFIYLLYLELEAHIYKCIFLNMWYEEWFGNEYIIKFIKIIFCNCNRNIFNLINQIPKVCFLKPVAN